MKLLKISENYEIDLKKFTLPPLFIFYFSLWEYSQYLFSNKQIGDSKLFRDRYSKMINLHAAITCSDPAKIWGDGILRVIIYPNEIIVVLLLLNSSGVNSCHWLSALRKTKGLSPNVKTFIISTIKQLQTVQRQGKRVKWNCCCLHQLLCTRQRIAYCIYSTTVL